MIFYHVTDQGRIQSILQNGLIPTSASICDSEQCVYLWSSIEEAAIMAADMARPQTHRKVIILKVAIPKSWVKPDDRYLPFERQSGLAWKVSRSIPPSRIKVIEGH